MGKVQILAYDENEFIITTDAEDDALKNPETKVEVGINPLLKYREDNDIVGCQFKVAYRMGEKTVMVYSAILSVWVEGWSAFLATQPGAEAIKAFSAPAWKEVMGFARGAIFVNAKVKGQNAVANRILPPIEINDFVQVVALEKH